MGKELFNYVTSKLSAYPNILKDRQSFWGEYAELNNIPDISVQNIHDKQMNTLQGIANQIRDKYKTLNEQLFGTDLTNIYNPDGILQEVSQGILDNIFNLREAAGRKGIDYQKDVAERERQYYDVGTSLLNLRNILSTIKVDAPIVDSTLAQLNNILDGLNTLGKRYGRYEGDKYRINSMNSRALNDFLSNINQTQGYLLEALGTQWFNERIPSDINIKAINTGKLNVKSKQVIQDIMMVDMTDTNLMNDVIIQFTIKGEKQELPLGDFLNKLDTWAGPGQISIDDQTMELIESLSFLNIQAKSGKSQLPWNRNVKNSFKIEDLDESMPEWGGLSAMVVFQILQQLSQISIEKNIPYIETAGGAPYQNIVNYAFSAKLGQLMNYSTTSSNNQYLLTSKGFISFADRMKEILGEVGYIRLIGDMNIDRNVLTQIHNVGYTTRGF